MATEKDEHKELKEHARIQKNRLGVVLSTMTHMLNDWREEAVLSYPAELPAFEELLSLFADIRFAAPTDMRDVDRVWKVGDRVKLKVEIDRYPNFVAPKGAAGTVAEITSTHIHIKMDEPIRGCEEWDNCIMWGEGEFDVVDGVPMPVLKQLERDVERELDDRRSRPK
jgi:hypothetical protein